MLEKIMPTTYLLTALLLIILLHYLLPIGTLVPSPWNLLGLAPLALGIALNLIADRAFKQHDTSVKPYDLSNVLITDGVFRISRHPMYLGFVLVLLGIALLLGSTSPYVIVVAFGVLMDVVFIRMEESMLNEQFPEAWREYTSHVRRWI